MPIFFECKSNPLDKSPLHYRLESLEFLDDSDWQTLANLFVNKELVHSGAYVLREKDSVDQTRILLKGWACRYKTLADGQRQILNLMLPGDIIGFYAVMRNQSDYGVEALTPIEFSAFPATQLIDVVAKTPRLIMALSWIASQSERLLDEQITRIGRRNAAGRMAHLFVELFLRLRNAGFPQAQARFLPLSQSILSDVLGMSHVHANRSFRILAKDGAVSIRQGQIHLDKIETLARRADFDPHYLEQIAIPEKTKKVIEAKQSLF